MAVTYDVSMTFADNAKALEVLDAFCEEKGWTQASGLTKQQFLKREIIEFVKLPWVLKKRELAQQTADTSVTIT